MRDALVSAVLIPMGELRLPEQTGPIIGFLGDPYDAAWDDGALNAITDDERLDLLFPDDPLSRLRALLDQIRHSITLAAHLLLLGIVQSRQQKPADALESLSRASNLFNGVFGPDHPKTAVAMGYLACAQLDLEHLDTAAELFAPALKVLETTMPEHPAFGTILLVYGRLLSMRDPAQGKAVNDRALGIIKHHPAPNILLREFAGASVLERKPRDSP